MENWQLVSRQGLPPFLHEAGQIFIPLNFCLQLRMCGYNQTLVKELEQLKDKWNNVKNLLHHSHLSDVIGMFLMHFCNHTNK